MKIPTHTPKRGQRIKHGLRSTYTNHSCRCLRCYKANEKYMKRYRANGRKR
jgi:hypothetical protein